jgi:hypothetical protein
MSIDAVSVRFEFLRLIAGGLGHFKVKKKSQYQ